MSRTKSSQRWMKEHFDDPYVKKSQKDGYRSRAVYKLEELDQKYQLVKPGCTIVDLGAAPGGWSQYAAYKIGSKGKIFALDILPMDPLPDVDFIQGDFREESVLNQLLDMIGDHKATLVLSDMAPNLSGMSAMDQPRSMLLAEMALEFCEQSLQPGGSHVVKLFQGEGFDQHMQNIRQSFNKAVIYKPKSSRPRSREVFAVATGFKG